ncbi:MAG: replicative DNA helicase [Parcubacteria group bacterium]|nr:replicative DNA helicase [Parcubacteria group bacterium]
MPPQHTEAEISVLGAILLDPQAIIRVADTLEPTDFYRQQHQLIYEVGIELFSRGEPIDILSLSARLEEKGKLEMAGGKSYLAELINTVPTAANAAYYAALVRKKKILRDLIEASGVIGELAFKEKEDIEQLLDSAEQTIFRISQRSMRQNFTKVTRALEEAWERLDRLHKGDNILAGVPTGFTHLDDLLAGLHSSDLIVLAARPSLGKTSLALDIARNAAVTHNIPVGVFSLEMSTQQVVDRLLAAEAHVNLWRLRTGKLSTQGDDFLRIRDALERLSKAPIFIDDAVSNTALQMRAMARRLQAEHGLGLVIVDYLQIMQPGTHSDNMVQQITEISRSLKGLARELNVPVLALSQLSRAVEQRGGVPRLSDLRDSGCLTGDTIIVDAKSGVPHTIRELAGRSRQCPLFVHAKNTAYAIQDYTMTKVFYSGKKQVYRLTTQSGRSIKASANHPFLTLNGWCRLDTLVPGKHIAIPRTLPIKHPSNPRQKDELVLLAHLIGDGCILPKQPYHYTSASKTNLKTVTSAARALFSIRAKRVRQENWYHLYLPSPFPLARGRRHPITVWFEDLGIERVRSYEKRIPNSVMECDEALIALFLSHLWATDGNLSWKMLRGRKPAGAIYYASSSKVLAGQVQHLLLRLGIQSAVRTSPSSQGYRPMYHTIVEGAPNQLVFLRKIGIADERAAIIPKLISALEEIVPNTNTDSIPREAWHLVVTPAKERLGFGWRDVQQGLGNSYNGSALMATGISRSRMLVIGQLLESKECTELATSDILWDKVLAIEPLGIEDVYDATVPGVHNFVANDILVHNSIEQDADVVMFIYREDKYKENTQRKNQADILVAKHRNGPLGKVSLYFHQDRCGFSTIDSAGGYEALEF